MQAQTASTTQLNYYNNVNFSRKNNKLHNLNVIFQQAAMGMNEPIQAAAWNQIGTSNKFSKKVPTKLMFITFDTCLVTSISLNQIY